MRTYIKKVYACFPGGKHKALTMSYDDGKQEDRRLVEIFNQYGIKGTFNVNSGLEADPVRIPQKEYKELYKGHEVACHTVSHPTIGRCPTAIVAQEIIEDRKRLEALMGYPVRGLAYPNGSYSEEICALLPGLGIRYGRIVGDSDDFALPENFLQWKATCHHDHNLQELAKQFVDNKKKQNLYLMYVWGHSYEFDGAHNWEVIEKQQLERHRGLLQTCRRTRRYLVCFEYRDCRLYGCGKDGAVCGRWFFCIQSMCCKFVDLH